MKKFEDLDLKIWKQIREQTAYQVWSRVWHSIEEQTWKQSGSPVGYEVLKQLKLETREKV